MDREQPARGFRRWRGHGRLGAISAGHLAVGGAAGAVVTMLPIAAAVVVPVAVCGFVLFHLVRAVTAGQPHRDRRRLITLTAIVFAGHLGLSVVIYSSTTLLEALGPDATAYHWISAQIADAWYHGDPSAAPMLAAGKEGFVYGLASIYWLVGSYPIAGLVVNSALSAATLPVVYDTTRRLFGTPSARIVVVMLAVLPGFAIWSSQLLREASVIFFLAVTANALVRLTERVRPVPLCVLGGSLAILFSLRANVALVAFCGAVVGLGLGVRDAGRKVVIASATVAVVAGFTLVAGVGQLGLLASLTGDLEQVNYYREALGDGAGSAVDAEVDISSPSAALAFLPSAASGFLLGPFPWEIRSAFQATGLLDAVMLWALLPSMYRGLRSGVLRAGRRLWCLLAPAALLVITLSLLISNYGMILRQRPQVLIFLIPVAAHGWAIRRTRNIPREAPPAVTTATAESTRVPV